ncbi:hypothetical protein [Pseudomonas aeruginosa]|uniref:hypothetical protein n=1 Tax=Pseudomonas aeruginosa TaxID=287 RepID=UPI00233FE13A|nr:hypothetical protein [Pseudomonas aeruginosa]MDC3838948.1 hypothetical protein [Pseudomonas aeruginosa]
MKNSHKQLMVLCFCIAPLHAYAWSTRDFGNDGPHPELLSQSVCAYDSSNYYSSGPYNSSHKYTAVIAGNSVYGDGSGGANSSLGLAGTGIYTANGRNYFVGRYAEYVEIREGGGREASWLPYYKYQICYYSAVSFSYYGYENSTQSCPAARPSGTVFVQRRYEVWTDGSVRNYGGWYETGNTCQAVLLRTENQAQSLPCASYGGLYKEGGNGIVQSRSRDVWSDGERAWSAWVTTSNSCYRTVQDERNANTVSACAIGQKGRIVTKEVRQHTEKSVDSGKSQSEKDQLADQSGTAWTVVVTENTCKDVPTQSWNESGQQVLKCSDVKGSSWSGEVVSYGYTEYTYNSATKATTSRFVETSRSESCAMILEDLQMEFRNKACPSGYSGTIVEYNYFALSGGTKIYPNGENALSEFNNSCAPVAESSGNADVVVSEEKPEGLLSNISISSSQIQDKEEFQNYLKSLGSAGFSTNENHTLNLSIDDLSNGKYDSGKISEAVSLFVKTVGTANSQIKVSLPMGPKSYIGKGKITADAVNNRKVIIQSVRLEGNSAVVKYKVLDGSVLNVAIENTEKIILFNTNGLNWNISSN